MRNVVALVVVLSSGCALLQPVNRPTQKEITVEYRWDRKINWDSDGLHAFGAEGTPPGTLVTLRFDNSGKGELSVDLCAIKLALDGRDPYEAKSWQKKCVYKLPPDTFQDLAVGFPVRLDKGEEGRVRLASALTVAGAAVDLPDLVVRGR